MKPVIAASAFALFAALPAQALEWRSEGPDLGIVYDLAIDPRKPDTVYASLANAGVFRSDDFGRRWQRVSEPDSNLVMDWLIPDPARANTFWGGSSDELLKSNDGGVLWHKVVVRSANFTGFRIAFAPSQPGTIHVPNVQTQYRSLDGGKTWDHSRVTGQDTHSMAVDPKNPKRVYAGGRHAGSSQGQSQNLSVSEDGGNTWRAIGAGLPKGNVGQILIPPQRPSSLYVRAGTQLLHSTDYGASFTELATPDGKSLDPLRDSLYLDPTDPDRLWLIDRKGLHRGGSTGHWTRVDRGVGTYMTRSLAIDARNPRRLLLGKGGDGVYRSEDGGDTWTRSSDGLHGAKAERVMAAAGEATVFAQTSAGLYRHEGNAAWSEIRQPFDDGRRPAEPRALLPDLRAHGAWFGLSGRDLWHSVDGGRTWTSPVKPPKEPSVRQIMKGVVQLPHPRFDALAQDPSDPKRLYAGGEPREPGQSVFLSVDGGSTWKLAGNGLGAAHVERLLAPTSDTLLAVDKQGQLHRSQDAGANWQRVTDGWPDTRYPVWSTDPTDSQRIHAVTGKGLFRSLDGGRSWRRQQQGVPESVTALAVSPTGAVVIGNKEGIFVSRDGGGRFEPLAGSRLAHVLSLAFGGQPLRLYAATSLTGVQSTEWTQ